MAGENLLHRLRMLFPQLRTPFDVSEQEGDGPRRQHWLEWFRRGPRSVEEARALLHRNG